MKRQGLQVTINQLEDLIQELERQTWKNCQDLNLNWSQYKELQEAKHQINIINKEGLSDTWEIEG